MKRYKITFQVHSTKTEIIGAKNLPDAIAVINKLYDEDELNDSEDWEIEELKDD